MMVPLMACTVRPMPAAVRLTLRAAVPEMRLAVVGLMVPPLVVRRETVVVTPTRWFEAS